MTINEIKNTKVKIEFEDIYTTIDNLLSRSTIKSLAKELQGESDNMVIEEAIYDAIINDLSIDDIAISNFDLTRK